MVDRHRSGIHLERPLVDAKGSSEGGKDVVDNAALTAPHQLRLGRQDPSNKYQPQ